MLSLLCAGTNRVAQAGEVGVVGLTVVDVDCVVFFKVVDWVVFFKVVDCVVDFKVVDRIVVVGGSVARVVGGCVGGFVAGG